MSQTFDPNAILFIHPSHPSMRRQRYLRKFQAWMRALTLLIILCLIYPTPAISETLRLASYTATLERNASGLLYREIIHGKSSQIRAALRLIATIQPDISALHDGAVHWPAKKLPDPQGNSHRLIWEDVSLP
ncbi:MAG: hypothetical protein L7U58_05355 [Planktomarina sp.]|nr:hypothetical protein [Planktomarina sp.]